MTRDQQDAHDVPAVADGEPRDEQRRGDDEVVVDIEQILEDVGDLFRH